MILAIAAAVLVAVLFLIAPSVPGRRAERWRGTPFAHRGLYGGDAAENTLPAFARACEAGFGIELDVQLSRDGEVVVFHDDTLERMTGDRRRVDQVDLAQLQAFPLGIPTLKETLALVNGRTPLLIEIKSGARNAQLCRAVTSLLKDYRGEYLVESFHPLILLWLRRHAPQIIRGQLVNTARLYRGQLNPVTAFLLSRLILNFLARPDFVAYNIEPGGFAAPHIQRALFRTPMAAWTVRDPETYRACLVRGEMPIFEQFDPRASEEPTD